MCGICGLAALDGRAPVDPAALRAMNAALVHRGPDSAGELVDGPVGLAARRLAVIDPARSDQPIASEDGRVQIVQNGEIYNYRELRAQLRGRGHHFATDGDTEVLVHLYEERGLAFAEALRGMFAVAIWDARERRLVIARDPYGIKPLYWTQTGGRLAFASELRALARLPGWAPQLDPASVEAFLTFNAVPGPRSIYAGAHKLPAGHLLVLDAGGLRTRRYARPGPVPADELLDAPEAELAERLRERLADAVRAQLVADVPVGVLLSGGIDSSTLTALAAHESSEPVRTFSIGFAERSFDELALARQVAARYATEHHELVLRPDAALLLPELAGAFDEPFADSSALPTYLVARLAAEHVKVVLSGEGADELFGGYFTYVADLLADRVPGLDALARLAAPLVERLPSGDGRVPLDYKAKRFVRAAHLPPLERHHAFKEIFSPDARAALLDGRRAGPDPVDVLRARYGETAGAEPLARLQDVDLGVYLVDDLLVKTDRASMAHGLEARVPFLDPAVTELALALPSRHKVRGLAKKRLLRTAAAPLLPEGVARGPKRGFSIPAAAWLRGELEPFAREVLSPARVRAQGWLDPVAVTRTLDEHVAGHQDHSRGLWGLLAFGLWLDARQAGAARAPGPALAA